MYTGLAQRSWSIESGRSVHLHLTIHSYHGVLASSTDMAAKQQNRQGSPAAGTPANRSQALRKAGVRTQFFRLFGNHLTASPPPGLCAAALARGCKETQRTSTIATNSSMPTHP